MESVLYREIFGEGEAKGEARGEVRGEARGEARSILRLLANRGIAVSDAVREKILACTDIATLDAWFDRAGVVSTAAGVVRAKTPPRPRPARPAARWR